MKCLSREQSGLTAAEYKILSRLSTPSKIQDFLDTLPFNFEKKGDTHMSPRKVLENKKAHCIEGALLAAAALWINGEPPIIMNFSPKSGHGDFDHVVALYQRNGRWGAISKTNHACLRFRDPIYRTPRELAISYFHEWFIDTGKKVLEQYSRPTDMRRFKTGWITAEEDLWNIGEALDALPYYDIVPRANWQYVRKADPMELKAGTFTEWSKSNPRT